MRFLHTSDWHLGRTLHGRNRHAEFASFLGWQHALIEREGIGTLLVAGDVFDSSAPGNRAQKLYHEFLNRMVRSSVYCHMVIVSGNHDSSSFLEAPETLLRALDGLIESSDGKRFRNFAQGLTFDIAIGHANGQLTAMSNRYRLMRSLRHALDLDVVDAYHAGEVRSTRNISGGENFIVSLALALGLSCMSSRSVRVDSLFLDEGFGTIGKDSLDMALQTLAGLRQNGKIIGVISHVAAVRERIAARTRVHPVAGGRSRLSGPGVTGAPRER